MDGVFFYLKDRDHVNFQIKKKTNKKSIKINEYNQNLHRSLSTILIKVLLVKKFHFCFLHPRLLVLNKLLLANNELLFCIDCLSKITLGIHLQYRPFVT